jgi:hypothetical protein
VLGAMQGTNPKVRRGEYRFLRILDKDFFLLKSLCPNYLFNGLQIGRVCTGFRRTNDRFFV